MDDDLHIGVRVGSHGGCAEQTRAQSSQDSPPDLELLPELWGAQVVTETCFGGAAAFMRARPCTFTMACLLEVQGRWQQRGIDVLGATVPCIPPPEIAARLSWREIANYQER